jgi:hypothetical protein
MLSYPIDEAEELLDSKLSAAKQNLANCEEDLDFLREQITVRDVYLTQQLQLMQVLDYGGSHRTSV